MVKEVPSKDGIFFFGMRTNPRLYYLFVALANNF
jgi:hypothetical protein